MSELLIYNVLIVLLCAGTIWAQVYSVRKFTVLLGNIEARMAYLQHDIQVRQLVACPEPEHAPTTPTMAKKRQAPKKAAAKKPKTKRVGRPKKARVSSVNGVAHQ